MADYDISKAFETIENELIDSMMRNFKHHRAEEEKEGYNWTQWQSEQLKSLEQYRRTNQKKYGKQFSTLNKKIEEMLKTAMADGNAKQEAEILKAIKKGFKVGKVSHSATGEFFKVNDRKLDALINATKSDMEKAETAILRMSNDKYRKAIFNAQVYANSGAGTYEKAVDMAVKDMLQAGLNCVEYRNGARHTLSDYADMAIRTANKRAYLYGEGQKRQEWGISLVVVNSRQGGCPDCAQYIGRVFIDDVYSGGSKADGNYPLLSEAIAGGLFHPRCKDSTSTYYEGITSIEPVSNEELAQMEERETLETKQQNAERQEKRYNRLAQHSLDEDNKIKYQNRADDWHTSNMFYEKQIDYMSNSFRPKFADTKPIIFNDKEIVVKKVENSKFDLITDVENTRRNKAVRLVEKQLNSIQGKLPAEIELPQIAVIDFYKNGFGVDAIGGYDKSTGILYINSKYNTINKIIEYVNRQKDMFANKTEFAPLFHELGHKFYYDSIQALAKAKNIEYNKAKDIIDEKISSYIQDKGISKNLRNVISDYARIGYREHNYTEIIAEVFSIPENEYAKDLIELVGEKI